MWHRVDGETAMNMLFDSGIVPDGVVALNDMLASGVMHAIQMRGYGIPDDVTIVRHVAVHTGWALARRERLRHSRQKMGGRVDSRTTSEDGTLWNTLPVAGSVSSASPWVLLHRLGPTV